MSLMDAEEWDLIRDELAEARADNEVEITIHNRATTPTAQRVRIVGLGGQANSQESEEASEARATALLKGPPDLDVRVGDQFTHDGVLYQVSFVDVQRRARTSAELRVVQ